MYSVLYGVAVRMINKQCGKNRHLQRLSKSERREKAHNAASYIVEQYITRPDFLIERSATAYVHLRVMHELFYRRKVDGIVDFVDFSEWRDV